jgi:hypothetical protein
MMTNTRGVPWFEWRFSERRGPAGTAGRSAGSVFMTSCCAAGTRHQQSAGDDHRDRRGARGGEVPDPRFLEGLRGMRTLEGLLQQLRQLPRRRRRRDARTHALHRCARRGAKRLVEEHCGVARAHREQVELAAMCCRSVRRARVGAACGVAAAGRRRGHARLAGTVADALETVGDESVIVRLPGHRSRARRCSAGAR